MSPKILILCPPMSERVSRLTPPPTLHKNVKRVSIPKEMQRVPFVLVRVDAQQSSLSPKYMGPYEVLERRPTAFQLKIGDMIDWIALERLKPAHGLDLSPARPPRRGRPPGRKNSHAGPVPTPTRPAAKPVGTRSRPGPKAVPCPVPPTASPSTSESSRGHRRPRRVVRPATSSTNTTKPDADQGQHPDRWKLVRTGAVSPPPLLHLWSGRANLNVPEPLPEPHLPGRIEVSRTGRGRVVVGSRPLEDATNLQETMQG